MLPGPQMVYYEPAALAYPLGRYLQEKYANLPWEQIESHNSIPFMQQKPNSAFMEMKRAVIVGVRKTHKYVPNQKTSDFLVPYTSSGCSAACLYCYLVCNYNKCSYLRLFVNREQMLAKLKKTALAGQDLVFEIGSNSDLVLENSFTQNLEWTIPSFGRAEKGFITFPTKFDMVSSLLPLHHHGRTIIRMSVNPQEIIQRIEIGTSPLSGRLHALAALHEAGYKTGLLIAPVILLPGWQQLYTGLLMQLRDALPSGVIKELPVEIIFMTYSYIHRQINREAFPSAPELYDPVLMTVRGRGRYCYRPSERAEGEVFFRDSIAKLLPQAQIQYIV